MPKLIKTVTPVLATVSATLAYSTNSSDGYNLPVGVTPLSRDIYDLHMLIFWVCVVIAAIVYGLMAYSIVKHRKSRGVKPAQFHESTKIELLWTAIPLLILIAVAIPATSVLIDLEDSSRSDMSVKITGYQWKWKYEYVDGPARGISFFSNLDERSLKELQHSVETGKKPSYENYLSDVDNELVLPVNKKIRFLVTSNDVIHSWWVTDLGVKQDAIPGFIHDAWATIEKPGVYRGHCAELCGKNHAYMPVVVRALPEDQYLRWIDARRNAGKVAAEAMNRTFTMEELIARGKGVFGSNCAACHGATGAGVSGVFPALANNAVVKGDIKGSLDIILNGRSGTAMQAFRDQLNDADIASVLAYIRNAFGNNVGDFMQPLEVKQARN